MALFQGLSKALKANKPPAAPDARPAPDANETPPKQDRFRSIYKAMTRKKGLYGLL